MIRSFEISVKYAECKAALQRISDTELPEAIAAGINRIASGAAAAQRMNLRRDFILRNKYTEGSLAYYKANPKKDIARINAIVGSKQPYLALQETGGERRPVKGSRVPVPTMRARGGNWKAPIQRRYTPKPGALTSKFFVLGPATGKVSPRAARAAAYRLQAPAIFKRDASGLVKVRLLNEPSYHLRARHWHTEAVNRYATMTNMQMAFMTEARRRIAKYQAG
jgi:hypothetical protein